MHESEGNKEDEDDKFNRVDILVKNTKGELIIIEVQNSHEIDYFLRILFGISKAITENIKEKLPYKEVKKIISVSIVYFDLGQGEDYVYHGKTTFKGIHKGDLLQLSAGQKRLFQKQDIADIYPEIYLIKVDKYDDQTRDALDEWIYFFKNSEIKQEFKAKGLQQARKKLAVMNMTEAERKAYEKYLDNLRFEASMALTYEFEMQQKVELEKEKAIEKAIKPGSP